MVFAGRGDLGYAWRMQEPRSLDDVDTLLKRQEQLAMALGDEVAADVRAHPEDFADAEAFRNYHAKARFRATVCTIGGVMAATSFVGPQMGYSSGRDMVRRAPLLVVPAAMGLFVVNYAFWNMMVGYSQTERNKYLYAKNIRMLRNLQIAQ